MIKQAYNELAAISAPSATAAYDPTVYTVLTPAQTLHNDLSRAVQLAGAALPAEMATTVEYIQRDLGREPASSDRLEDAASMIGHVLGFVESQQEAETVRIPVQLSSSEQAALQAARDALRDSDPHGLALGAVQGLLTHASEHELAA